MNAPLASLPSRNDSHDGRGWADHDVPFEFGHLPRALAPAPFTIHQFARLLVLRSRLSDQALGRRSYLAARIEATPEPDVETGSIVKPDEADAQSISPLELATLVLPLLVFGALVFVRSQIVG
jgi:hypothetical protein